MPTVVITGGSRGLGLEMARRYVAGGFRVVLGNRGQGVALEGAETFRLDVSDGASVKAFAERLASAPVDVLINNAGVIGPARQSTTDMDFEGFAEALAINTLGPLRVTQALLPNLRAGAAVKVAVLTSRMGSLSYAKSDRVAYRASKAAANKVVQCLATDLAGEGIAVAALHPGWARTDMGGAEADVDPVDSAKGLVAVIERLSVKTTGRFWNYDGTELAW